MRSIEAILTPRCEIFFAAPNHSRDWEKNSPRPPSYYRKCTGWRLPVELFDVQSGLVATKLVRAGKIKASSLIPSGSLALEAQPQLS
jgi:hypothetical protein